MLSSLLLLDRSLTNFIFHLPHNLILNSFFGFFSITGMSLIIWLAIFTYLIFSEEKKHKEFIVFFLTSLLISSFLANVVIKNILRRQRPFLKQSVSTEYPSDFSFPSGHATASFAAATILAYFDRKRKKLFYLVAILISFSRIYLGYHYFFDVIFGAFLGWLTSWLILKFRYET